MSEELDLDWFDSLNLSGQRQPSGMPSTPDFSLDERNLDDILLAREDMRMTADSMNSNDFINDLINPSMNSLPLLDSSLDAQTIASLISSSIEDIPEQSVIEDIEQMTLTQAHTDILSSSNPVQIGSSPVEQKEIEHVDVTRKIVRHKQPSKARKNSSISVSYHQPSSTVGPIDILSSYSGCQPYTTASLQHDLAFQQLLQFDSLETTKIQILAHPRSKFRPRTQNESKFAAHYLRCEPHSPHEYPTILIPNSWAFGPTKTIIGVSLVALDLGLHAYAIDNKSRQPRFDNDALIFQTDECQTLYFCVTEDDFKNGYKSFMIEHIKSKQDEFVTKDLIRTRQLEQSMLRFTRFYQTGNDGFKPDENSVEYSCIMKEEYTNVSVEHVGPRYGPMGGNERVYALMKGQVAKDDVMIFVTEDQTAWCQQVSFTKNGNTLYFSMPAFPHSQFEQIIANIVLYYKGDEFYRSPYLYKGSIDHDLTLMNLDALTIGDDAPSTSDAGEFFLATGAYPPSAATRRLSSTARSTKRLGRAPGTKRRTER